MQGSGDNGAPMRRSAVPPGLGMASIDLEQALQLLALPRELGPHPEDGEPVVATSGRCVLSVQHLVAFSIWLG